MPLFAVRARDGRARVFRNACRHRGMALVEGPGCAHAFVCRYHGWTYRLDGSLSHVPHAEAFPDLDMSARGLVEVDSREVDGLIIIGPLQPPRTDAARHHADAAMAALADGSPWRDKLLPADRLFAVRPTPRPMNWKVLVEQFLEGYHIRTTHKDTFYPIQYDDLNVVEAFGPNTRITFPYKNIEHLRDRPESTWTVGHRVTYVYHLFPNVMFATYPNQVLVITIDPIDIDQTTVTIYAMVTHVAKHVSADPTPAPRAQHAERGRGRRQRNVGRRTARTVCRGKRFRGVRYAKARSALPRQPRRTAGVVPLSDYEHLFTNSADRSRSSRSNAPNAEYYWAEDTSRTHRCVGPLPLDDTAASAQP